MEIIDQEEEKENLIKKIRSVELKIHKIVESNLSGDHHSLFKGQGIEFDEVREYIIGDDVKNIDWNVTSRMNYPYVKRYHEERELIFSILFDNSASSLFGSGHESKKQVASELAAALAFSITKNRDMVGFLSYSNHVEYYLPPAKGKNHAFKIISESLFHQPTSPKTDLEMALRFLSKVQPKRSVIFIISDFLHPINYEKWMRIMTRNHNIFAIQLVDPMEYELPDLGLIDLQNLETGENVLVDSSNKKIRHDYSEYYKNFQNTIQNLFLQNKIKPIRLNIQEDYFLEFSKFFKKKH